MNGGVRQSFPSWFSFHVPRMAGIVKRGNMEEEGLDIWGPANSKALSKLAKQKNNTLQWLEGKNDLKSFKCKQKFSKQVAY
jgi:hypothetical protein